MACHRFASFPNLNVTLRLNPGISPLCLAVIMPGFILLCIGGMAAHPSTAHRQTIQLALFFFFALLAIPNNLRFAKRYAHQLRELERLELRG
jgi:hypothetical protein